MKNKLTKNIGPIGRIVRFLLAVLLLGYAYEQKSWILLLSSLFVFFESLMSWCVIYQIFGKGSCPINRKPRK